MEELFLADTKERFESIRALAKFNIDEVKRYNMAYNNTKRVDSPFVIGDKIYF